MFLHWILGLLHHLPLLYLASTVGVGLPEVDASAAGPIIESGDEANIGDEAGIGEEDGNEGEVSEAGPGEGSVKGVKTSTETKVDWKTIPTEVRSHIQEITKTNPKLGNLLQNAVYTSQTFLREVPGGLKEIRALKQTIEDAGGSEEIKNLQGIHKELVNQQENLDNMARTGNPMVLDNLIEIAGDGFSKLMPTAMDKWQASDPEGYQYELSKLMVTALKEGGVVSDLNMAFSMLKLNTPEALKEGIDSLKRIADWVNGIGTTAKKVPEKPQVDPKIAEAQKNIDNQKAQLFNNEFSSEFGGWRNRQIVTEVGKVANGRQLTEYQMETLGERVVNDIKNILTSDEDYMKNLRRLYDARDKGELLRYARTRTAKLLPEAVKKAYRSLFSNPVAKKKAATATTTATTTTVATPVKGWQKVDPSKAPTPDQIDSKKTPFEMKFKKQAILTSGQKVYWGTHVPS